MARKGGCVWCSTSTRLLSRSSQDWKQRFCCRRSTARPRENPSNEKHLEATSTDAVEVERLARRLKSVSQRMADILRRVLDHTLSS